MIQWLTENWLAFYGALVGTIALGLNLVRFIHLRKRDSIQLEVYGEPHESYEQQVQRLIEGRDKPEYDRASIVEVYRVRITNTGSIPAYIEDAGVVTKQGESISVLCRNFASAHSNILVPLESANAPPIEPKSSEDYWVWLKIEQEPFEVASVFALDKTGKCWRADA